VARSSAARVPPSAPARSIPWIDNGKTKYFFPLSGIDSSVIRTIFSGNRSRSEVFVPWAVCGTPAD
jgi:hypothetical protein